MIKVENPAEGGEIGRYVGPHFFGAGDSQFFQTFNRNKKYLALDLKKPQAYEALKKLLAQADVLLWNVRPSAMARLKLSYEDVKAINPRIIYCGIVSFVILKVLDVIMGLRVAEEAERDGLDLALHGETIQ